MFFIYGGVKKHPLFYNKSLRQAISINAPPENIFEILSIYFILFNLFPVIIPKLNKIICKMHTINENINLLKPNADDVIPIPIESIESATPKYTDSRGSIIDDLFKSHNSGV